MEMDVNSPILLELLTCCTMTKKKHVNSEAIIGLCTSILCKHRRPSMCLLQEWISL